MIPAKEEKTRLLSLDFFRGFTVAAMILVNNPGDWGNIYAPLEHSKWNGCTPTDLVFPFFLFMVGVSIVYAIGDKKNDSTLHKKILLKALRRTVTIFALALLLTLIPDFNFTTLRIPGVLQRISVVFFICVLLYLKTSRKTQVWLAASILVAYYLIMNFIPVPGFGPANTDKGTNLAAWLDRVILTENHMWNQTKTWDPEGILSTLPSIVTCLLGILAGTWLKRKDKPGAEKVAWLFCSAAFLILSGLIWDGFFPINKALWTSSFVLYAGGLATAGLTLAYWFIDVQGRKKYTKPFVVFGANAITIYVVSGLLPLALSYIKVTYHDRKAGVLEYLYNTVFLTSFSPINASLAWAIFYVLLFLPMLWIMYNKKIFIKI